MCNLHNTCTYPLQVAALRAQLAGLIRASQEYSQQRDAEVAAVQAERALLQEQLAVVRVDADTSRQVLVPVWRLLIWHCQQQANSAGTSELRSSVHVAAGCSVSRRLPPLTSWCPRMRASWTSSTQHICSRRPPATAALGPMSRRKAHESYQVQTVGHCIYQS